MATPLFRYYLKITTKKVEVVKFPARRLKRVVLFGNEQFEALQPRLGLPAYPSPVNLFDSEREALEEALKRIRARIDKANETIGRAQDLISMAKDMLSDLKKR